MTTAATLQPPMNRTAETHSPARPNSAAGWMLLTLLTVVLFCTSCADDATEVREEDFMLTLPGRWLGGYDAPSDAWIYVTPSREEGLTVRIQPHGAKFDEYLQSQRRREELLSDERLMLSEPQRRKQGKQTSATYDGVGNTSQRRTRTLLVVSPTGAGNFHYEAFGLSQDQFAARADTVLRSAGLLK